MPIGYKKQQIVSVLTTTDKKITTLQQRLTGKWRLKVDVDSESNLEICPLPVWWNRYACSTLPGLAGRLYPQGEKEQDSPLLLFIPKDPILPHQLYVMTDTTLQNPKTTLTKNKLPKMVASENGENNKEAFVRLAK